ncbi:MAG: hypothetical protein AB9869_18755 [Verrucomicrobiia bacterium]
MTAIVPFPGGVITSFSGGGIYLSPDGNNLGGGGIIEHAVKLLEGGDEATTRELGTHDDVVTALAVTPDSRLAISGCQQQP